jgi:hypothetical protein
MLAGLEIEASTAGIGFATAVVGLTAAALTAVASIVRSARSGVGPRGFLSAASGARRDLERHRKLLENDALPEVVKDVCRRKMTEDAHVILASECIRVPANLVSIFLVFAGLSIGGFATALFLPSQAVDDFGRAAVFGSSVVTFVLSMSAQMWSSAADDALRARQLKAMNEGRPSGYASFHPAGFSYSHKQLLRSLRDDRNRELRARGYNISGVRRAR